jgi:hypothetical protein
MQSKSQFSLSEFNNLRVLMLGIETLQFIDAILCEGCNVKFLHFGGVVLREIHHQLHAALQEAHRRSVLLVAA